MVTIKDIAKAVGASYSTVSRALNNMPGTRAATRERILAVAQELGYEPNAIARSLVTNRTLTLAFILPDLSNPFFSTILQAAEQEADLHGYQLLICETRWDADKERREIKMLSEKRVDGILLYPAREVTDNYLPIGRTPMVVFGRHESSESETCRFIEVDNAKGCRLAIQHLLACGYDRLAYVGGPPQSLSHMVRLNSFLDNLRKKNLSYEPHWVMEGEYSLESGHKLVTRLLRKPRETWPNALVCANDMIALGALQALSELGVQVPQEMGVVGFDDVCYASLPQIQLTTVHIPREEMGRIGTRLLFAQLDPESGWGQTCPAGSRIVLEPRLVKRKTTARIESRHSSAVDVSDSSMDREDSSTTLF